MGSILLFDARVRNHWSDLGGLFVSAGLVFYVYRDMGGADSVRDEVPSLSDQPGCLNSISELCKERH